MVLELFDVLDSTNTYAKLHMGRLPHGSVIRARYQTAGRGQYTRTWQSTPNENFLFSITFKTNLTRDTPTRVETIMIQTLQSFLLGFGVHARHVLPNDLYVGDKKICGMLIEAKHEGSSLASLVIGCGLNINQRQFTNLPDATSLSLLTNQTYPIDTLFDALMKQLFENLNAQNMLK
jgi:biotin-[acetyl-CoA-carboxylase] ligase BirA-like protein